MRGVRGSVLIPDLNVTEGGDCDPAALPEVQEVLIAVVIIDPPIEGKLRLKHGLTGDMIREALVYRSDIRARLVTDDVHGERLEVRATTYSGTEFIAYLLPANEHDLGEGTFVLKTAFVKPSN